MKIVHLATTDIRGGACRGSYWLHRALLDMNVDSTLLVARKYSDDDSVTEFGGAAAPLVERIRGKLDGLPLHLYRKTDESFWTLGWQPRDFRYRLEEFAPDIVHIHWTGGGFMPIDALSDIPCPAVWTLRDMWAFTGGCHYTGGCMKFETGCGRCPQLRSDRENDLSRRIWERKFASWRTRPPLNLVTISRWLADCVAESPLFNGVPIDVIPNGLDSKKFRPTPRHDARDAWDLDPDKHYILFGALDALRDERKGFGELTAAARMLADAGCRRPTELVIFGDATASATPDTGLPVRFLGHIDDDDRLAKLYSAADVMVVPSRQEAFGKTLIEAMGCGTPVVAFDHGGPSDIVLHQETGYLSKPFEASSLAEGISWCLGDDQRLDTLGDRARKRVERTYDLDVIARQYQRFYEGILAGSRSFAA